MYIKTILVTSALLCSAATGTAQETLEQFTGDWQGSGEYVRLNGDKVTVQCALSSKATASGLNMNGRCTALLFISRDLSANIKAEGRRISGWYSGPEGNGALRGERTDHLLDLSIEWEKPVRGDNTARMQIEAVGRDRLRLITFDLDPSTNSTVAVTDLLLQRK